MESYSDAATFFVKTRSEMLDKAASIGVLSTENEDIRSLREMIIYGLKGMAAYTEHANNIGKENHEINAFIYEALAATLDNTLGADELVAVSYTHLRAHETVLDLVCRLLLEKKKKTIIKQTNFVPINPR